MIEHVFVGALGMLLGAALGSVVIGRWLVSSQVRRVRAAERRARSAERLAELGAMTSGLAHEIKNPLSTIGLNAQLLSEAVAEVDADDATKASMRRRVESLRHEVERLRGILSDFLEFAGEVRLALDDSDLNVVTDELVDFFLPQAERQGVRLRPDLHPEPLRARCDAALVKQAALNLMLNAVQAMGAMENGSNKELILRTRPGEDGDGVRTVVLHVIDTGPGMDDATRAKVFEPYYSTKRGGTGLGLPTSRRLIEMHGGRMEVHSEPQRGSDFALVLPVVGPRPGADSGAATEGRSARE